MNPWLLLGAAYVLLRGLGRGGESPWATPTSNAAAAAGQGATGAPPAAPPSITTILDRTAAAEVQQYAALNPDDLQSWLTRYTGYVSASADGLTVMAVPPGGFTLTAQMIVALSSKVAQTVLRILNGGPTKMFTGLIPGAPTAAPVAASDLATTLTESPAAASDLLAATADGANAAAAVADGTAELTDVTAMLDTDIITPADLTPEASDVVGTGVSGSAAPIANLGQLMTGMAIAGIALDIGFTLIGTAPDAVKAIDTALDTAAIACLVFAETGVGAVLAVVIEAVKFIFDMFSGSIFGGNGLTHDQREAIETARYGQNLEPMFPEIADDITPREILRTLIRWTSGNAGGVETIAMVVQTVVPAGSVVTVGGRSVTLAADTILLFGAPGAYWYQPAAGESWGGTWQALTFDEMAMLLVTYAARLSASAQAGISAARAAPFNSQVVHVLQARLAPAGQMLARGLSLDGMDAIAAEYRRQPKLTAVANFYGFRTWQPMVGAIWAQEWAAYVHTHPHGSLSDFAASLGYSSTAAWRDAGIKSFEDFYDRMTTLTARLAVLEAVPPTTP